MRYVSKCIPNSRLLSEFNIIDQGLDVPTKVGRTSTGTKEQFWPDALPAVTTDSYGYQWELNPGLLGTSPLH